MRTLLALFTIFGFGALAFSTLEPQGTATTTLTFAAANSVPETAVDILTQVDRSDDTMELLSCTSAANDCTLRSAITIANNDAQATTITFADHFLISLQAPLPPLTEDDTTISASTGQEVHINGNQLDGSVLYILGNGIRVEGLYLYAAGPGYATLTIGGSAQNVAVVRNVIGDDDAPAGNCGVSEETYAGILIDAKGTDVDRVHAYIAENIIECIHGSPGVGILVATNNVVVGHSGQGCNPDQGQNVIRLNNGPAINLGDHSGNTVCYNRIYSNGGSLIVGNFNNNLFNNDVD